MKKPLFILWGLLAAMGVWAHSGVEDVGDAGAKPSGPHFSFAEVEFDFGEVEHSLPKIEHSFEFTNDGTAPLVVTRTLTSCNCVKVSYDKKPVAPGAKGVITVVYEVNKKEPGVFYKVIDVYSNSPEKRNILVVKGNATESER